MPAVTPTDRAFRRIDKTYRSSGGSAVYTPGAPSAPVRPFSAARAYDKLILLCTITLVCAIAGWLVVPTGIAWASMFVAFGLAMVSWFRMGWAKVLAPLYAVFEGVALGAISAAYATLGHGIVPVAIIFTAAVFLACLVLYRTGLVRVTPRMTSLAIMGAMGVIAVSVFSLFLSLITDTGSLSPLWFIIALVCVAVAVLNLFTDFSYIDRSQAMGVSADAEWTAAFALLTALVLVYLSILRILGSVYGGGGRR